MQEVSVNKGKEELRTIEIEPNNEAAPAISNSSSGKVMEPCSNFGQDMSGSNDDDASEVRLTPECVHYDCVIFGCAFEILRRLKCHWNTISNSMLFKVHMVGGYFRIWRWRPRTGEGDETRLVSGSCQWISSVDLISGSCQYDVDEIVYRKSEGKKNKKKNWVLSGYCPTPPHGTLQIRNTNLMEL